MKCEQMYGRNRGDHTHGNKRRKQQTGSNRKRPGTQTKTNDTDNRQENKRHKQQTGPSRKHPDKNDKQCLRSKYILSNKFCKAPLPYLLRYHAKRKLNACFRRHVETMNPLCFAAKRKLNACCRRHVVHCVLMLNKQMLTFCPSK